jgi:hypothetical protein
VVVSAGAGPDDRRVTRSILISAQDVLGVDLGQAMMVTLRACSSGRTEVRGAAATRSRVPPAAMTSW